MCILLGDGLFLEGEHAKGTKFYCVLEEDEDVVIDYDSHDQDYSTFSLGNGAVLSANGMPQNALFLINHNNNGNVKMKLCEMEFINEKDCHTWVIRVELQEDVSGSTELVYDYEGDKNKEKSTVTRMDTLVDAAEVATVDGSRR